MCGWGSSNQLKRAKDGSRQLVGVLRCNHGVEDVVLFIPMLLLSEEFGVPLLPDVTKSVFPRWVPGDSWEVTALWGVAEWLFTDLSVMKVLELYSVLLLC